MVFVSLQRYFIGDFDKRHNLLLYSQLSWSFKLLKAVKLYLQSDLLDQPLVSQGQVSIYYERDESRYIHRYLHISPLSVTKSFNFIIIINLP